MPTILVATDVAANHRRHRTFTGSPRPLWLMPGDGPVDSATGYLRLVATESRGDRRRSEDAGGS
ncbi:hypothetical protein CgIS1_07800 [Frankia sp. CgS1]|nr:hypothetical protein CgIS1_07800 [Frankia sp. CgIS1]